MPTVLFANLALLGGLAALAIPILIHLLLKRKKQRLRFSTIQFFVKQDEQSSKRRRLRNWLLLAVRLLLVTLLVLAFARPYWQTTQGGNLQKRRTAVFIMDRSASMHATVRGETQWNRAVELVRKTLADFKSNEHAALVSCSTRTETVLPLKPASVIARALKDLTPQFGTANLADGLREALRVLPISDSETKPTIYLVSDFQKNACRSIASVPLPDKVEVKLLNTADLYAPNLAISDLRLEGHVQPTARVNLRSFSDEASDAVKLSLAADGKEIAKASVSLAAGAETNVAIALPGLKPGWHSVEARLQGKDALAVDDARYQALFIPEPLRVLCAETKKAARISERDSYFVTSALQPHQENTDSIPALFAAEATPIEELQSKLTSTQPGTYAVVFLPALRQIPANLSETVTAFVRNGGGLLLFIGEGVSANRYNAEFRELLPAQLSSAEGRGNSTWRIEEFDKTSPVFEAFQGGFAANMLLPEFTRRFGLAAVTEATVLASFDDRIPTILTRNVGSGRVLLVNSSADASWTDWPKRKSFVPWLHGAVSYLAGRSSKDTIQPSVAFAAGEEGEVLVGKQWAGQLLALQSGGSKAEPAKTDEEGRLQNLSFVKPGIYSVGEQSGAEVRRWAVNVSGQESDLATLAPQEFQKQLVRSKDTSSTTLQASLFGAPGGQKELWRVLLLCALVLLFLEVFLANRTAA